MSNVSAMRQDTVSPERAAVDEYHHRHALTGAWPTHIEHLPWMRAIGNISRYGYALLGRLCQIRPVNFQHAIAMTLNILPPTRTNFIELTLLGRAQHRAAHARSTRLRALQGVLRQAITLPPLCILSIAHAIFSHRPAQTALCVAARATIVRGVAPS